MRITLIVVFKVALKGQEAHEDNTNLHYSIQLHRDYHTVIQNQYFDFKRLCEDDPSVAISQDDQEALWNYSLLVDSVPVESRFPPAGLIAGFL